MRGSLGNWGPQGWKVSLQFLSSWVWNIRASHWDHEQMSNLAWVFWGSQLVGLSPASYFPPHMVATEAAGLRAGGEGVGGSQRIIRTLCWLALQLSFVPLCPICNRHVIYKCIVPCILTFLPEEGLCLCNENHLPKRERTDMIQNAKKPGRHEAYNLHRARRPMCGPWLGLKYTPLTQNSPNLYLLCSCNF